MDLVRLNLIPSTRAGGFFRLGHRAHGEASDYTVESKPQELVQEKNHAGVCVGAGAAKSRHTTKKTSNAKTRGGGEHTKQDSTGTRRAQTGLVKDERGLVHFKEEEEE